MFDDSHLERLPPQMRATMLQMRNKPEPRRMGFRSLLFIAVIFGFIALVLGSVIN